MVGELSVARRWLHNNSMSSHASRACPGMAPSMEEEDVEEEHFGPSFRRIGVGLATTDYSIGMDSAL